MVGTISAALSCLIRVPPREERLLDAKILLWNAKTSQKV